MNKFVYETVKFPIKIVFRPFRNYMEIKDEGAGSLLFAIAVIVALSLFASLSYNLTGFLVNNNNATDYNGIREFFGMMFPILLLAISNYSVTVLFNGKGTFREIMMVTGYSLYPYLVASIIALIFSNMMISNEIYMYFLIINIGVFFTGLNVLSGIIIIHEYSLREALLTIVFTIMAFIVILFIIFLTFSLFLQIDEFFATIFKELIQRIRGA